MSAVGRAPSSTRERSRLIAVSSLHEVHRLVESRGPDVIALHIGEPHLGIPEPVREAYVKAIRDGHSYYCDAPGLVSLREALSERFAATRNVAIPVAHLFVTPGSCQAIAAVLLSLAVDDGVVLLPEIHWPMHLQQIRMAGLRPRFYRNAELEASAADALDKAYEPTTCAVIVNSPSNPAGEVLGPRAMRDVYEWARRRGVQVLSDEAYEDFVYEGAPATFLSLDEERPESERRVFSFHTFSKSFSLTGYRLGYVSAPNRERAALLQRVQEAMLVSPSTPVQFAGIAALADHEHLRRHREYVRGTRDEVVRLLTAARMLETVPNGGWYALVDLSPCPGDTTTACQRLLDERGVALAPGPAFASADHVECRRLARVALCRDRESTVRGMQTLVDWARN